MKHTGFLVFFCFLGFATFAFSEDANNNLKNSNTTCIENFQTSNKYNTPPIALNDTFILLAGCGENQISGDLLANDYDPNGDKIIFYFSSSPTIGDFAIDSEGVFNIVIPEGFLGSFKFEYFIKEKTEKEFNALAEVIIYVKPDYDCDSISDDVDIDDDSDGILDIDEGNIDSDNDGIVDSKDVDSDNDGITDNEEWQKEGLYRLPVLKDINNNGWDDSYDTFLNGTYYKAVDTNNDEIPDFLDIDSDNDGVSDYIEGFDSDNDGDPEIYHLKSDSDRDGLDDAFDTVDCWKSGCNSYGSNSPLPDTDNNGIRNWRELPIEKDYTVNSSLFSIYPNPANQILSVTIPEAALLEKVELSLYSMTGQLMYKNTISNILNQIGLSNYRNGTYIAKIESGGFSCAKRLVIRH